MNCVFNSASQNCDRCRHIYAHSAKDIDNDSGGLHMDKLYEKLKQFQPADAAEAEAHQVMLQEILILFL